MSPIRIEQCDPARMDVKYFVIVGGLLVLIIAVLAQLWQIERSKRITAENKLAELYIKENLMEAVEKAAAADAEAVKINRDELARETVDWNGQKRSVLLLDTQTGTRLGLATGDVLLVRDEIPTTLPAR